MSNTHPMTIHGKELLEKELEQLVKVDREEIKVAIAEARAHGDLKENAEYHAAKEKQGHIEGRIAELQGKLGSAKVVDTSKLTDQDKIVFGATVRIFHIETENSILVEIVGEDEAKTAQHKISYASPLAKALIGKEEGDEVIVKAPKGDIHYEVEEVEYK
jgi:transcription elongation factor GreA